jgi:bacteriophage N4 adsorption protein B
VSTLFAALTVFVLLGYFIASFDDFLLNIFYLLRRRQVKAREVAPSTINLDEPQRIAIMIPAWQESGVVAPMIRSTLELAHYPASRLEFFVGVYPNDPVTVAEVQELAKQHRNVHCVINTKSGPTNKSQNLNEVYAYIENVERVKGREFAAIAIHDAEDVIHPYTFRLYNSLLSKHAVVQLPVFAIFPKTGFWGRLVSGTYADEFAEHHLHHIPTREALGLFVPSAGTGFAIRRDVARRLVATGPLFREGSLTEDYEFALRLWKLGCKVHFHLQKLERIDDDGNLKREYVAVREYFPSEVQASIKQKGRWTYGITLQTPKFLDWSSLNWRDKLTLFHDQKGKYTNLFHLLGYPLTLYALLSLFVPLPGTFNAFTLGLGLFVLFMTLTRLTMRFFAVKEIYGTKEAALATLFPPLLPIRWLLATYINTMATLRAWRLHFFPNGFAPRNTAKTPNKNATPKWDKTERKGYVAPEILAATKRRLGDDLLFYNDVKASDLAHLLKSQRSNVGLQPQNLKLGELITEKNKLNRMRVLKRLSRSKMQWYSDLPASEHHAPGVQPLNVQSLNTLGVQLPDALENNSNPFDNKIN